MIKDCTKITVVLVKDIGATPGIGESYTHFTGNDVELIVGKH